MQKVYLAVAAAIVCLSMFAPQSSRAAIAMSPLTTFGNGDGWLAPGEGGYTFLGTANNERGMAYGNGHLYLVSRSGGTNVRILDPNYGTDLGGLNVTGITGGTFVVNCAAVGGDGQIYVANLTTQSTTSPFKIYKWATELAAPVVAYSGDGGLAGSRIGDSLAGTGTGASTVLAAGFGSTPAVAGNNSYTIVDPTASTAGAKAFTGTPPNAGDFRLGITFIDSTHVVGDQGSSLYRYSVYSGASATLIASPAIPDPAGATADRLLSYKFVNGQALLAVQSIGDSHVSVYDLSDPSAPVYLASGNNTTGTLTANGNGTGQLAWGDVYGANNDFINLYAMSSNQGIQAFAIQLPEPSMLGFVGVGLIAMMRRRK